MRRTHCLIWALAAALSASPAWSEDRVLLVGDSWAGGLWFNHTMRAVFAANGRPDLTERGDLTAVGGSTAEVWSQPESLQLLTDELVRFPTIDTVQLTVGGNDFLAGREGGGWFVGMTSTQEMAMVARIAASIGVIVDHVLAHSASMEVVISLYDYLNFRDFQGPCLGLWEEVGSPTSRQINDGLNRFHDGIAAAFAANPRVAVADHRGLMQWTYGFPDEGIPPGTLTPPGNLDLPSPRQALDDCIHLLPSGLTDVGQELWRRYYDRRFNGSGLIFSDGFEQGSTAAWTATLP
ncbi:MAG: hypothetical protein AAGM22_06750 [Acidobacteriota bacterium]